MALRIAAFDGEYAELAVWTSEAEEDLRSEDPGDHWLAWDGDGVVGAVHLWRAPDGRHRLFYDKCRLDAYAPLATAIDGPCYATLDADAEAAGELLAAGFVESRREHEYEIPVALIDAGVPEALRIISAADTDLETLMLLDCALRDDIPGADGWQPDLDWFREETYDSGGFDPLTYRVALDGDDYVGLARVWVGPQPVPRLGMVGVRTAYRRKGLARALIAQAFAALAARGVPIVTAEVDVTNEASNTLMRSLGGRVVGGSIELYRPL